MSRYDGRRPEPPYLTATDIDEAELNERERCAVIAETLEWKLSVLEWISFSKKLIAERIAREIAEAIRGQ